MPPGKSKQPAAAADKRHSNPNSRSNSTFFANKNNVVKDNTPPKAQLSI
jgi:hypothetical protein